MLDNYHTDTPVPIVDLDIVARNIARLQTICDTAGVQNMPHFKTHKSLRIAQMQIDAGAVGITCQKLAEAEILAAAGFGNILISYNVLGSAKAARLQQVAEKTALTVACDNPVVAQFLSKSMAGSRAAIMVLVECDTGRERSGVTSPKQAADLASVIAGLPGLKFAGLMTYAPAGDPAPTSNFVAQTRKLCAENGLEINRISAGGTPGMATIGQVGETEYRAGTYVYNDLMMIAAGAATQADCALLVHATLVSNASPDRAIIDAGSKVLTSDTGGLDGFGLLIDYPEARIYALAEEHGFVDLSACLQKPQIGEIVRVLPNHVCPVSNLQSDIGLTQNGHPAGQLKINARGASK